MSPFFNKSSNSFLVQEISLYSIFPKILSFVSISAENLETFLIIAIFQPIEFSKSYFSKLLDHFFV